MSFMEKNQSLKIYAYCFSALSFCFMLFLIANSLLIKSPSQLSDNIHIELIDIQNQIDLYDKEIYKLTNQIDNSTGTINKQGLRDRVNSIIVTRNNQVDEFKYLYDDYIAFEKIKSNLSFLNLLKYFYHILLILLLNNPRKYHNKKKYYTYDKIVIACLKLSFQTGFALF